MFFLVNTKSMDYNKNMKRLGRPKTKDIYRVPLPWRVEPHLIDWVRQVAEEAGELAEDVPVWASNPCLVHEAMLLRVRRELDSGVLTLPALLDQEIRA